MFLNMQYRAGVNHNTRKNTGMESTLVINTAIKNDTTNSPTNPIPVALTLLLPFIIPPMRFLLS